MVKRNNFNVYKLYKRNFDIENLKYFLFIPLMLIMGILKVYYTNFHPLCKYIKYENILLLAMIIVFQYPVIYGSLMINCIDYIMPIHLRISFIYNQ